MNTAHVAHGGRRWTAAGVDDLGNRKQAHKTRTFYIPPGEVSPAQTA